MEAIISLALFVGLLLLGLIVGGTTERRHLANLAAREQAAGDMLSTQLKSFPAATGSGPAPTLLVAEVVIASDYLKTFLGGLRKIFGGEVVSYQRLVDRSRREATLRLLEQARSLGYNAVCNIRLETADVGGANTGRKAVMSAVLASGTAYCANPAAS